MADITSKVFVGVKMKDKKIIATSVLCGVSEIEAVEPTNNEATKHISKRRTASFQGAENDVAILKGDLEAIYNHNVAENISTMIDIPAKPRTALIQGREDDETLAPHIVHSKDS
jgi:hypothetical protein